MPSLDSESEAEEGEGIESDASSMPALESESDNEDDDGEEDEEPSHYKRATHDPELIRYSGRSRERSLELAAKVNLNPMQRSIITNWEASRRQTLGQNHQVMRKA